MYSVKTNTYLNLNENGLSIGYVPRIGFNVGQFRVACEYNFIIGETSDLSYFSFKLGYEIGGGKKWF